MSEAAKVRLTAAKDTILTMMKQEAARIKVGSGSAEADEAD